MNSATVSVENLGGISELEAEIPPGVTVLSSPNASNKTSLLRSIMAALGSDDVSIKGNADEGRVSLQLDGETYERTFTRTGTGVSTSGNPFLDDTELAELFAFLLPSNEARRAVETSTDLRELIMRPVDTDAIQRDIERLQQEKERIQDEIDEVESLKRRLPELEERKQSLESEIEEKRAELEEAEAEIAEADASVEDQREEKDELESKLDELRTVRSTLDDVRYDIETKRESLDSLKEELRDLEEREEELDAVPQEELSNIEEHIDDLRAKKQDLDAEISELQNTIRFNEKMVEEAEEGTHPAVRTAADGGQGGAVTDRLLQDTTQTVCWTCGSEVEISQIEDTLQNLQDLRRQKIAAVDDVEDELETYKERKNDYERQRRNREQVTSQIARTEREIESTEEELDRLTERREELTDEVEELEREVEALESDTYEEVLELHRTANELEYELGKLETKRDDVADEIEDIEAELDRTSDLHDRREEIADELVDLRTKIDQIEQNAVEEFNDHMEQVLAILDYDNIDRIWIEIVESEVRQGRRKVQQNTFELHVVRSSDSGVVYEDTVEHLSESEREVTGLVFALAGYLVHDVYQTVPFMLMDALEAIDSDRIAALIEYFESYVDYLVVALLPEDADALDIDHHQITELSAQA